jgi:2,3-dihydroxybenzoate decarboxylase
MDARQDQIAKGTEVTAERRKPTSCRTSGARRLAAMDAGIDVQVVPLTAPSCEELDAESAVPVAKDANDRLFWRRQGASRSSGWLCCTADRGSRCIRKGTRASRHPAGPQGRHDQRPRARALSGRYWSIFECAQALGVPIYLHPTLPHPNVMKTYFEGYDELSLAAWGLALETCTHFLRLVFAGIFDTYPGLKIILGRLGEGLPFWVHRINHHTHQSAARRGLKKTPAQYLRDNLVVRTSGNLFTPAFLCTVMAHGSRCPAYSRSYQVYGYVP